MKNTIIDYKLALAHSQTITMPVGAKMLSIHSNPEEPDIPVLSVFHEEPEDETVLMEYEIMMISESTTVDEEFQLEHIDSFQIRGGTYPVHVFLRLGT